MNGNDFQGKVNDFTGVSAEKRPLPEYVEKEFRKEAEEAGKGLHEHLLLYKTCVEATQYHSDFDELMVLTYWS